MMFAFVCVTPEFCMIISSKSYYIYRAWDFAEAFANELWLY